ncbi:hypothetical protein OA610_00120 [Prochlorococcus sp. AH-716-F13]|nr:hypothetical protein [Prochlorococcus sp. AH-716-F13]
MSSANEFLYGEEFEKALELYEKAIKLGHYQSFLSTAICKIYMFETEKALDDLDKLISKVKPSEKMHFLMRRGIIKWHCERYQEAIDDFDIVIESANSIREKGVIIVDRNNHEDYWDDGLGTLGGYEYDIGDKIYPVLEIEYQNYLFRGICFFYLGKYQKAEDDFSSLLECYKDSEYVHVPEEEKWDVFEVDGYILGFDYSDTYNYPDFAKIFDGKSINYFKMIAFYLNGINKKKKKKKEKKNK